MARSKSVEEMRKRWGHEARRECKREKLAQLAERLLDCQPSVAEAALNLLKELERTYPIGSLQAESLERYIKRHKRRKQQIAQKERESFSAKDAGEHERAVQPESFRVVTPRRRYASPDPSFENAVRAIEDHAA